MADSTVQLPSELFQRWRHSFEEDVEDLTIYRPSDYAFPPARGRAGIEFLAYGGFIDWVIAPTDTLQSVHGQWRIKDDRFIRIDFEANASNPFLLEIVECSNSVLKLRRTSISK